MGVIAKRYAEALINTAIEANAVENYGAQLDVATVFMVNSEVKDILEYPGVNIAKKKELIKSLMNEKLDKNIIHFLMILLDNNRLKYFTEIVAEYKVIADKYRDILFVEVTTAVELNEDQINRIKVKLSSQYGTSNIKTKIVIDTSVIGGVKLKIGDTVIDGTVKARLESLENVIKQR